MIAGSAIYPVVAVGVDAEAFGFVPCERAVEHVRFRVNDAN